jgi:hypothetical protein
MSAHDAAYGLRALVDALAAHPEEASFASTIARFRADCDPHFDAAVATSISYAAKVYGLSAWECLLLRLALLTAVEPAMAQVFARWSPGRAEPTARLAAELLPLPLAARPAAWAYLGPDERLGRFALVTLGEGGPVATRALTLPDALVARLCGATTATPAVPLHAPEAPPDGIVAEAWAVHTLEIGGVVHVVGPAGSGRDTRVRALGAAAERPLLLVPADAAASLLPAVRRDARWWGAGVVLPAAAVAAGWAPGAVDAPCIVVGTPEDPPLDAVLAGHPVSVVRLAAPDLASRRAFWTFLAAAHGLAVDIEARAGRHALRPARVAAAIQAAAAQSVPVDPEARLDAAIQAVTTPRFGRLATRLPADVAEGALVAPPAVRRELDLAILWARQAPGAHGTARGARGVGAGRGPVCLFHGPPGTGKTLAARVLAAEVGRPLYRVDLSQLVDKYIGETEKHLARLFDEAREADLVLLFDEADAVFGRRTAVRDSNDRYANIETGFLLQRIEDHEGPVILTTNLLANLDEAFLRRLHVVASFALPTPGDLRRIWDAHLPTTRADDIDLAFLAERFPISGGEVRNAATTAALLAASVHRSVGMAECVVGVVREVRKAGRLLDPARFGPWRAHVAGWEAGDPWR